MRKMGMQFRTCKTINDAMEKTSNSGYQYYKHLQTVKGIAGLWQNGDYYGKYLSDRR